MSAHRTKLLVVCALACLALVACGGAQSRKTRHMSRGQEFFLAGNYEKARVEFRNALQIEPNDSDARFMHGQALERLGNLREAAGMYQAAIDANTNHLKARANLARMFVFAGAPERALEYVEPGLLASPTDPDLLTSRAAARIQMKDIEGGMDDARKALELAPENENAAALLASSYRQQDRTADAIAVITRTLERVPKSVDLRQVLANLYTENGDLALAEKEVRAVVALKPENLPNRYQLAVFLLRDGRVDDAEAAMNEAVKAVPEDPQAKLALVEFLDMHRSREQAEARLRKFIAEDEEEFALRLGLATLQQRHGELDRAVQTLQDIVSERKREPEGLTARNRIAGIRVGQKRYDDALKLVGEVLEQNPRDLDALLMRGNIALEQKRPDVAIADLRAVLRDQPAATNVMRTLARAHLANGEPALAEENLRAAVEAAPADVAVAIDLGQLLTSSGRAGQAVTLLETAVRRAPQDASARAALVQAYVSNKDFAAARIAARDLKTLAPNQPTGAYLAGLVEQADGKFAQSEVEFEAALTLAPDAADALAALARSKLAAGKSAEAEARVLRVAEAMPGNASARNLYGELLLARKDFAGAARAFETAITAQPQWWLPYRNLALTQLGANDSAAATATLQRGLEASGNEPSLATELAALNERLGKFDAAIQVYDELHRRDPQSELVANNLAMLLVTYRGDQASLDKARDLTAGFANSNDPALLDTHAWVRVKRGEYSAALPLLERAIRQKPDSPVIRYHLAAAQLQSGQRAQAQENLELALAGKGTFAGVESARAMLAELRQ
jgi:Flp pilus assembly protein TadD